MKRSDRWGKGPRVHLGQEVLAGKFGGRGRAGIWDKRSWRGNLGEGAARASGTRGPGGEIWGKGPRGHLGQEVLAGKWREGGISRSWRFFANANRGDWLVKNAKWFCKSFRLFRKDKIASKIIAGESF